MAKAEAGEPARILVVDDEVQRSELMEAILTSGGYEVFLACGGEEGLRLTRETNPDHILLDLMMPGMSGLEVMAKLGELIPDSPVIIVTANSTSDNAITALRLGAFDVIV